jgi:hypothetical protein
MKSVRSIIAVLALCALTLNLSAQPVGKFSGYMFGDYFYNAGRDTGITKFSNVATGGSKDQQGFQFRRIYLTYDNTISDKFMARFRLEADQVANTSDGKIGVFVKDAFLRWKNIFSGSDLYFGIQPTPAFEISEGVWGYRALDKTIMDLRGIVSSRDLAVSLKGKFDEAGDYNYWFMVGNSSGNKPETDKYKRIYGQLHLKPAANLQVTVYGDINLRASINDPNSKAIPKEVINNDVITTALFVGYGEKDKYSIGVEGFLQITNNGIKKGTVAPFEMKSKNALGFSVFGSYNFEPAIAGVVRFDYFDPNTDGDFKGDARNYILAGLSWKPDKNVSVMPNIQIETYQAVPGVAGAPDKTFKASVTPRVTLYYVFL